MTNPPTRESIVKAHPFVGALTDAAYARWFKAINRLHKQALRRHAAEQARKAFEKSE